MAGPSRASGPEPSFFHYVRYIAPSCPLPMIVTVHPGELPSAILEVETALREMYRWLTPDQLADLNLLRIQRST